MNGRFLWLFSDRAKLSGGLQQSIVDLAYGWIFVFEVRLNGESIRWCFHDNSFRVPDGKLRRSCSHFSLTCIRNPDSFIIAPRLLIQTHALRVGRISYEHIAVTSPCDLNAGIALDVEDLILLRIERLITPSETNHS